MNGNSSNNKKNNEAEVEVAKSLKSIIKSNEAKKKDGGGLVSKVRFKATKKNKAENKLLKVGLSINTNSNSCICISFLNNFR